MADPLLPATSVRPGDYVWVRACVSDVHIKITPGRPPETTVALTSSAFDLADVFNEWQAE